MKKLVMIVIFILLLTACGETRQQNIANPDASSGLTKEDLVLERKVIEVDYELALYTNKSQYAVNEPIDVYAELTYIGELEEVEIGHSMYPVGFSIMEHTRDLDMGGAMEQPYIVTLLKRNEPIQYKYSFSGGYSSDDDADYIAFVKDLRDEQLPQGEYTITAYADFKAHEQESSPPYRFSTSISFIVSSD
ncbi:hypothetical protein [Paenibacillus endoradicis]|uniref:hypothetical protein n=1 Tax=Paenibacillus endoradicis TaxID=2972487 RepID=UPI00215961C7|nr:hypothetical protein [Paenibacillus endoradicis]MCR8659351.1 hypothetical protein [Paenibacillus endoradicis]